VIPKRLDLADLKGIRPRILKELPGLS